jgi:thiol-disulfide isomerase/thioredoxin
MQFFNQTFTKHLEQLAGSSKGSNIEVSISQKRNYVAAMSAIEKADSLFSNDTLRELLLLKGLNEYYYAPKINKNNVLSLLTHIEQKGLGADNKKIASNLLHILTKMQVGNAAPEFELIDQNKNRVSISSLKGKYVYLDFWASWCLPCLQEQKLKQTLKEKYSDDISFVSISIDKKFSSMSNYLTSNKNLNSIFLYAGMDQVLLERYNVKAIPCYYLIDPQGRLLRSPAQKPSENIELLFQSLLRKR